MGVTMTSEVIDVLSAPETPSEGQSWQEKVQRAKAVRAATIIQREGKSPIFQMNWSLLQGQQ